MKKLFVGLLAITSLSSFADESLCQQRIDNLIDTYNKIGKTVKDYQIKDCSSITNGLGPIMDANQNTNAPKASRSNACVIIMSFKNSNLQEIAAYDDYNKIYIERNLKNLENTTYSVSRIGDKQTGTISFIKSEGRKGKDEYGFLKSISDITRINYDLENDQMQLLKWHLNWFNNKYSHDYTVQCR